MSEELINYYKADEREDHFLLFEQFKVQALFEHETYAQYTEEDAKLIIGEALKFAQQEIGPLNRYSDRVGCTYDPAAHNVTVPPKFKEAQKKFVENGWYGNRAPEAYGGQYLPFCLHLVIEEFFTGACTSFMTYSGLAREAAHVIELMGTDEQKRLYAEKLYTGQWMGTMCLTEPGAGSEVGRSRAKAVPVGDGAYKIAGVKCFITAGEHDMAENIVHMVLARTEGAPEGTKGLSLFIIPKFRVNPDGSLGEANDVVCRNIEEKMGIHGSSTCTLNFGDNGGCLGWIVGDQECKGMSQMFVMMNAARIGVGMQALATASTAYLNALQYARERVQGKLFANLASGSRGESVAIIQHEDVRRMLMEMRCRVEGMRALILKLGHHLDRVEIAGDDKDAIAEEMAYVDLLTPIVKAYCSDQAFRIAETAIQVYGGAGYIQDYPVEQYCRDIKIQSIYEGTNYIQALDLVGRKLNKDGGRLIRKFIGDVQAFVKQHQDHEALGGEVKTLGEAANTLAQTTMSYAQFVQDGSIRHIPLTATRYLEMLGEVAIGRLLLDGALIAHEKMQGLPESEDDFHFYAGKVHTTRYFIHNVLPYVKTRAQIIASKDASALEIDERQFPLLGAQTATV